MNQMKSLNYLFFLLSMLSFVACEEKMTEEEISNIGRQPCRKPAEFISQLGFDASRTAYSTEGTQYKGVLLLQAPATSADTAFKKYQHPTWSQHGYMASVTTDDFGNAYCFPIPVVNTMDHTLKTIHTVYKIDSKTGVMEAFTTLPLIDSSEGVVPFGMLGIYFDCHGKKLYVSSVGGSTRDKEMGMIYMIDPGTGKIQDQFKTGDAVGLCVGGITGEKRLYFGKGRLPEIWSIRLDKKGYFKGDLKFELSLDQLGPRGDDKARKIRFDQYGNMQIYGVEFNYSLAAQSEKPETFYRFGYNQLEKKWVLLETK